MGSGEGLLSCNLMVEGIWGVVFSVVISLNHIVAKLLHDIWYMNPISD